MEGAARASLTVKSPCRARVSAWLPALRPYAGRAIGFSQLGRIPCPNRAELAEMCRTNGWTTLHHMFDAADAATWDQDVPRAVSPGTLGLRSLYNEHACSVADFGIPRFVKPLVMSTGTGKLDGLVVANGVQAATSLLRAALWLAQTKESVDEARRFWNGSDWNGFEESPWWSWPPPIRHLPVTTSITFVDHLAGIVCVEALARVEGRGCGIRQHSRDALAQAARVARRLWHFVLSLLNTLLNGCSFEFRDHAPPHESSPCGVIRLAAPRIPRAPGVSACPPVSSSLSVLAS